MENVIDAPANVAYRVGDFPLQLVVAWQWPRRRHSGERWRVNRASQATRTALGGAL
jgi:hypothetical protein